LQGVVKRLGNINRLDDLQTIYKAE